MFIFPILLEQSVVWNQHSKICNFRHKTLSPSRFSTVWNNTAINTSDGQLRSSTTTTQIQLRKRMHKQTESPKWIYPFTQKIPWQSGPQKPSQHSLILIFLRQRCWQPRTLTKPKRNPKWARKEQRCRPSPLVNFWYPEGQDRSLFTEHSTHLLHLRVSLSWSQRPGRWAKQEERNPKVKAIQQRYKDVRGSDCIAVKKSQKFAK